MIFQINERKGSVGEVCFRVYQFRVSCCNNFKMDDKEIVLFILL